MAMLFSRIRDKQDHMLRNMAASLIEHGKVTTTTKKAKTLKPIVEKWITAGRKASKATGADKLNQYRSLLAETHQSRIAKMLIEDIAPRIGDRAGGYTRLYKLGNRVGDAAPQSMIALVDQPKPTTVKVTEKKSIKTDEKDKQKATA
jgi:large subunit ribosomal protein L17